MFLVENNYRQRVTKGQESQERVSLVGWKDRAGLKISAIRSRRDSRKSGSTSLKVRFPSPFLCMAVSVFSASAIRRTG